MCSFRLVNLLSFRGISYCTCIKKCKPIFSHRYHNYSLSGHCGTPSSSTRIHFTYGVSNAPVEDQYAVDVSSYQGVDGGVGNDWGAGRLLPNSETGKLPGVAQSEKCGAAGCGWYNLGTVPSSTSGNNIRITGYGTAAVDSRSQKTHVGALVGIVSTSLRYVPDTTGGNSGSPVIHEETGDAIGVHTHGGCSATGGSNAGTRIDRAEFMAHVNSLLTPCTQDSECSDGVFCNGVETCDGGICTTPPPPCSGASICNEITDTCDACTAATFEVSILTDNYPGETSWTLTNKCDGTVAESKAQGSYSTTNTQYDESYTVCAAEYDFTIFDSYNDGICCGYGSGSYTITYQGQEIPTATGGAFGGSETTNFGSCGGTPPSPPPTNTPTVSYNQVMVYFHSPIL